MPPKQVTDKFRLMLYYENEQIPDFATSISDFVEMWDDGDYSGADQRSIYESVLLVVLRKACSISDQEQLEPVLLEMALVKFLEIWLQWGTSSATKPGLFDRGPTKKTKADPADIAMFGTNGVFLQSITAIPEDKAIEYMTAANLFVTSVTKAAASAMPQKLSKPTSNDMDKVSLGLCYADNIALRNLDSTSVNTYIDKAFALNVGGTVANATQQYQFLVLDPTCYALMVLALSRRPLATSPIKATPANIISSRSTTRSIQIGKWIGRTNCFSIRNWRLGTNQTC